MKRKILGILISVLMVVTMIPSLTFAEELPFTDVAKDAWYYGDVKEAYDTGLINGMTATTFEPESNMTYAQAVKLAACMNQKYTTGSVTLVNGTVNWWDTYLDYAKTHNIINKDYSWNSNATRAGYVEIFAKALPDEALKAKNSIANGYIPDVGMSHPQSAAIYKLYRAGVLTGMDEKGTFQPDSSIKRSEVSAILTRMMNESARRELTLGPGTFHVIFNSTGGSAVETQQVAENGKAAKPEDPTRVGYTFVGWYSDSGLTAFYDFETPVLGDVYLFAKWEEKAVYKVDFHTDGGSIVEAQNVVENEKAVKPADPAREGYDFLGWYKDNGLTAAYDFENPVTENLTLYAKWEKFYTVTFNTNGGSAVPVQKIKENEKATKPLDPTRDGYDFVNWYPDREWTTSFDFDSPVTGDLILYAKWIEKGATGTINDSWEDIIASVNDGTYKSKYKIGDTKSMDLGSEGVVEMQIAAFDADELADGSGTAAITWISKQLLKSNHRMNPPLEKDPEGSSKYKQGTGTIGGWEYSEMRAWLKSDIQPLIPDVVRSAIKAVKKYSHSRNTSGMNYNRVLTIDDVWIPSGGEIYGLSSSSLYEQTGPVYTELFVSDDDRVKYENGSSNASKWWLRSANGVLHFRYVTNDGSMIHIGAENSNGVVLGFCL